MKFAAFILILLALRTASAQVVVDGKNINQDDSVQYIQLSFYYSGKDMLPIYAIDYGHTVADREQAQQAITIDGDSISSQMTPMNVLNKLYNSGWEYLGDAVFMRAPIVENTQTFTLKRRKDPN